MLRGHGQHRSTLQGNGCDALLMDTLRDRHIRGREDLGHRSASPRVAVGHVSPQPPVEERRLAIQRRLRVHYRLQRFVLYFHLYGTVGRLLGALPQNHGHGLADVMDVINGQQRMRCHRAPLDIPRQHDGFAEVVGGHHLFRPGPYPAGA